MKQKLSDRGAPETPRSRAEKECAVGLEKGGRMSTAVLTLNTWSLEYHETMVATERARLNVARTQKLPGVVSVIAQLALWHPFHAATRETEKLVSLLEKMETYPSSILLEEDAAKIPQSLHELFRKMCAVIQQIELVGLHNAFFLKKNVERLAELGQQISEFADRFEDAQKKLRSRIPAEQIQHYQESFAAYGNCGPTPEQAADDDDVKSELLHF